MPLDPSIITCENLRLFASWIRDDLDEIVAREGAEILRPEDVVTLHELFTRLQLKDVQLSIQMLSRSRIHCAVVEVAGKATRWPTRLADECDRLIKLWTVQFGPLDKIRPDLYGQNGRLSGIGYGREVSNSDYLRLWESQNPKYTSDTSAKRHGNIGFVPGSWWINGLFAFRDGIIDISSINGGTCFDRKGAYAIVLRDDAELESTSPNEFTFNCKPEDKGKYRLTSTSFKSTAVIRVLRSHALSSLWAPRVGIRYDGLHRVTGWSVKGDDISKIAWHIHFRRVEDQKSMEEIMKHPLSNEMDDFIEFRRLRKKLRTKLGWQKPKKTRPGSPQATTGDALGRRDEAIELRDKEQSSQSVLQQAQGVSEEITPEVSPKNTRSLAVEFQRTPKSSSLEVSIKAHNLVHEGERGGGGDRLPEAIPHFREIRYGPKSGQGQEKTSSVRRSSQITKFPRKASQFLHRLLDGNFDGWSSEDESELYPGRRPAIPLLKEDGEEDAYEKELLEWDLIDSDESISPTQIRRRSSRLVFDVDDKNEVSGVPPTDDLGEDSYYGSAECSENEDAASMHDGFKHKENLQGRNDSCANPKSEESNEVGRGSEFDGTPQDDEIYWDLKTDGQEDHEVESEVNDGSGMSSFQEMSHGLSTILEEDEELRQGDCQ